MGHGHGHGTIEIPQGTTRLLHGVALLVFVALTTLLVINWPDEPDVDLDLGGATTNAIVRAVSRCPAQVQTSDGNSCEVVRIEIIEGEDASQLFELPPIHDNRSRIEIGDAIVVDRIDDDLAASQYVFVDRDRKTALWGLAFVFGLTVIVLGGLRGARALLGLAASVALLGLFTMPALLTAQSPLLVTCLTAGTITFATLYLAHGFSPLTSVAVLGTLSALVVTVLLGLTFIELAHFSGFATEESFFIRSASTNIDLGGMLLAGLVIGARGALGDMTITQTSVVFELRRVDKRLTGLALFEAAMRIGRDHVAATVNTLFLAYAGASLPLLMLFVIGDLPVIDVLNSEIVATELVRALVGSIGLVGSVPLTTALAVWVVTRVPTVTTAHGRPPKRRPKTDRVSSPQVEHQPGPTLRQRLRKGIDD